MARHESDREDMIREATAFNPRVEWKVADEPGTVFAGIKRTGGLSVYFDQDPVYQFDESGHLRRAFVDGLLYHSEGHTLVRLQRTRSDASTTLLRYDLNEQELHAFQQQMRQRLTHLQQQLESGNVELLRSVSDEPLPDFAVLFAAIIDDFDKLAASITHRKSS